MVYKDVRNKIDTFKEERMSCEYRSLYTEPHEPWNVLKKKLRRATEEEYVEWLFGYLQNGNDPTHYYDYDLPADEFYVATQDFEISILYNGPVYGGRWVNIIVPKNINFLGGELGHSNIYLLEGYKCLGGWVPVYKDI